MTVRNSSATGIAAVSTDLILQVETAWREPSVAEKLDALLVAIAHSSDFPGDEVVLKAHLDHALSWSGSAEEFRFFRAALRDRGLVTQPTTLEGGWILSAKGWEYFAALAAGGVTAASVFVAMAFAEELQAAWNDGFLPGIAGAGYTPERADTAHHNGKIDDRIMARIRACRFLIVDATTQNRGAYFEAGFGMGLGRPVIWTVRDDDLPNVHFDTRQFNHVVWTSPVDLREKLRQRILGVFGAGPNPIVRDATSTPQSVIAEP